MGNCFSPTRSKARRQHGRGLIIAPPAQVVEEEAATVLREPLVEEEVEGQEKTPAAEAGVKVKVVLTRAELEWLMAQLKAGDRRLGDVLHQMGTARTAAAPPPPPRSAGWRPRLERIVECHEPAAT